MQELHAVNNVLIEQNQNVVSISHQLHVREREEKTHPMWNIEVLWRPCLLHLRDQTTTH